MSALEAVLRRRLSDQHLQRFAAAIDGEPPNVYVPALWHWGTFARIVPTSQLGMDGHPPTADALPEAGNRRRMFAGGRLRYMKPIEIGAMVEQRSRIAQVVEKEGRSGPLLFVTMEHEYWHRSDLHMVEQQDLVYLEARPRAGRTQEEPAKPVRRVERTLSPDPRLLFQFSAITANAHRIHYDADYARNVEGYPGLVAQGPLLVVSLLEMARERWGDGRACEITFRLHAPAFVGETVDLSCDGRPGGRLLLLRASRGSTALAECQVALHRPPAGAVSSTSEL